MNQNFEFKKIVFFAFTAVFVLFLINFLNISFPVSMTTTSHSSELAVVGEGKIDITPDTAYVDAGIFVNNVKTVQEAQDKITAVNNAIISSMQSLGVKKVDIKTSNFSINPDYLYESGKNQIRGYSGNVTVTIKTSNLPLVSRIIEAATTAGANQVQGARFTIDNPQTYREQVREKAIANAKEQAQKLSHTLGIKLGKITNIIESTPDSIAYPYMAKTAAMGLGGAPDAQPIIEPGTQSLSSTVTLYFEKK